MAAPLSEVLASARSLLAAHNIESAFIDADVLLAHALGIRRIDLIMERSRMLTEAETELFKGLIDRRIRREPVSYITGIKEFYSRTFQVNPSVLIPRPETEILVEQAAALAPIGGSVFEVGVGSGAVIVSVLCERPDLKGFGNDISLGALATASANARSHHVSDRLGLFAGRSLNALDGSFDVVIANPPYVSLSEMENLQDDVRLYEPASALLGGKDGLDIVKEIIAETSDRLKVTGVLIMEVGAAQQQAVEALAGLCGTVRTVSWVRDLAGIPRAVIMEKVHG